MKLSNDVHTHFTLEKEIGKIAILKKHRETLHSILKLLIFMFGSQTVTLIVLFFCIYFCFDHSIYLFCGGLPSI